MKKLDVNNPNTRKIVIEVPKTTYYAFVEYTYFDENGRGQIGIDSFRVGQEDTCDA